MSRTRVSVIIALALVAALLGACGGSSSKEASPTEVVSLASERTVEAGTSKMSLIATVPVDGRQATIAADGAFDYVSRRGTLTMDLSKLGVPGVTGTADLILTGPVFYMHLPGLTQQKNAVGKTWLKVDLTEAAKGAGIDPTGVAGVGGTDPGAFVAMLRGASDDLVVTGQESLRGETTTHYRGTFDLEKAVAGALPGARATLRRSIDLLGRSKVTMDVWIDSEGRLRKLVQKTPAKSATKAGGAAVGPVEVTIELFDFGSPVTAVVPPPEQIADLSSVLGDDVGETPTTTSTSAPN